MWSQKPAHPEPKGRNKEIEKAVVSKVRFLAPARVHLSTDCALMLDGSLERSGQCLGVELSQSARQLCLIKISQIEVRSNCRLDRNNDELAFEHGASRLLELEARDALPRQAVDHLASRAVGLMLPCRGCDQSGAE